MLSGINLFCFTASYFVAFALEVSRLFFRSGIRGILMIGFAAAGVFAQTIYLAMRATEAEASPLSTAYDWYLLAAWLLAASYLYLAIYYRETAVGVFLLPLVLALIGAAWFADRQPFAPERASRLWGGIHGSFLLVGTVAVMIGFAIGVMYLVQSYRLRHKMLPKQGFRLPSLEWLERHGGWALHASALLMLVGFSSGIALEWVKNANVPWTDPVILSSTCMVVWLLIALALSLCLRTARTGHAVAYLTLTTFVFVAVTLTVMLVAGGQHGGEL
jgi:ABC-type transport system involved in cytochrome c biogenesis permease subunit